MNKTPFNIAGLDGGGFIIKKGGGGGTTPSRPMPSRPSWTGHADVEGLKAIGWTDEDIAYYQENGVNWNAEDDEYHKVTDDNKALYGVLTASNISTYKERIVYLPKIDTSGVTDMYSFFYGCSKLVAIPMIDTSNVTDMSYAFYYVPNLVTLPVLDTSKVESLNGAFTGCYALTTFPNINISKVTDIDSAFYECRSLKNIMLQDFIKLDWYASLFHDCSSIQHIPFEIDLSEAVIKSTSNASGINNLITNCYALVDVKLKGLRESMDVSTCYCLSKKSILYIINNEVAESAITIKLNSEKYSELNVDPDIVAALANHPNVSLAK